MDNRIREVAEWVLYESNAPRDIKEKAFHLMLGKMNCIGQYPLLTHEYEIIMECIRNNRKIEAIKHLRQCAHLTLKEALETINPYFPPNNGICG